MKFGPVVSRGHGGLKIEDAGGRGEAADCEFFEIWAVLRYHVPKSWR